MQLISISKDTESGASEFAEKLAAKLGYACISRDDLFAEAIKAGIKVAKLEMAMINRGVFNEQLSVERDHYIAFSTAYLCEKILDPGLVYHGRTGHYLFPSLGNVLKLRVFSEEQARIINAMNKLNIDRNKAKHYIEKVEEDKRNWIKSMYGVAWEDKSNYALGINLTHIDLELAVTLVNNMASQQEFIMTNESLLEIQNLMLSAKIRIALANDSRTSSATFNVHSEDGIVTITYLPQDNLLAKYIPEVCEKIYGITDIRLTMATTNILWIQENFSAETEDFINVVDIAAKWNAAIELLQYLPEEKEEDISVEDRVIEDITPEYSDNYNGGIEDELTEPHGTDSTLLKTRDKLASFGLSGGGYTVKGDERTLINSLHQNIPYVLIIVGNVFSGKSAAARQRAIREFKNYLNDRIHVPVITINELAHEYLFTKREFAKTSLALIAVLILYYLVFTYQEFFLSFLSISGWYNDVVESSFLGAAHWLPKIIISLFVICFIPIVASLYGKVTNAILKIVKIE